MKIHPTAIVDPKAEIHESVEIGPFCIVEKDVSIGEGTVLQSNVRIESGTKIGKFNKFSHGCAMGGVPQDLGFNPELRTKLVIGDNNTFRESCIWHRSTKEDSPTVVGDKCFFMGNVHAGHDSKIGNNVIVVQGSIIGGHCVVKNNAFISGLVAIHQFVTIGEYSILAGLAKITKDVPPFVTVDGNPASVIGLNTVGLKRAGFKPEVRTEIKNAYKIFYHSGFNTKQALEEFGKTSDHSEEVRKIISFFEESKRGVTDHR